MRMPPGTSMYAAGMRLVVRLVVRLLTRRVMRI